MYSFRKQARKLDVNGLENAPPSSVELIDVNPPNEGASSEEPLNVEPTNQNLPYQEIPNVGNPPPHPSRSIVDSLLGFLGTIRCYKIPSKQGDSDEHTVTESEPLSSVI